MLKEEVKAVCKEWLESIWSQCSSGEQYAFASISKDDLIEYHMTLGLGMRNENKLWTHKEVIGCPDEFSMSILQDFWREKNGQ